MISSTSWTDRFGQQLLCTVLVALGGFVVSRLTNNLDLVAAAVISIGILAVGAASNWPSRAA